MTVKKIEIELHLSEEHLAKLQDAYKICNYAGIYESFDEFIHSCMDFRALHHVLDSADRLKEWSLQFEHCEQT